MSLFLAKQYWGTKVGSEEFDERHLLVDDGLIYVASFSGLIRIFKPDRGPFKPDQMVLEINLENPIMQILIGYFQQKCLCVLLFKKVAFYTLQFVLIKEFNLARNAFNMCSGTFGGVRKDMICIQSCDATLMIYEAETFNCMCQLSTEYFAIPGPIIYQFSQDAFILQNSCYELEQYKYSNLVAMAQKQEKRAQFNWTLNIGEQAQKIVEIKDQMYIICEQMIFIISSTGSILFQKKLDYPPASIVVTEQSLIISSFTHHLMIYKDLKLVWAAKTDHVCHGLAIGEFQKQKLVVTLNDEGYLQVLVMGTEQLSVKQELQQDNNLSYAQMNDQYYKILEIIKSKEQSGNKQKNDNNVSINSEVVKCGPTKEYVEGQEELLQLDEQVVQCIIQIRLNTPHTLKDVNVIFTHDKSIHLDHQTIHIDKVKDVEKIIICAYSTKFVPSNRYVNLSINWTGGCLSHKIQLPLQLFCYMIPPNKNAEYKITLLVNNIQVMKTFNDIIQTEGSQENPSQMTLQLANSQVTVLVSKQNDKWRIQSDQFESLGFILGEIIKRLGNKVQYTDQIPLQDIFKVYDDLEDFKQLFQDYEKQMEQKALEFRAIEKKLLSRFKESNPAQFKSLELLLQISFDQFMKLMDAAKLCQDSIIQSEHKLVVVNQLLVQLIQIRFNYKENISYLFQGDIYVNINYFLKQTLVENDPQKIKKIITILIDKISKNQL
ncbi:hypothetical protein pb186bvf_018883 [Paramecium bursaria]